MSKMQIVLALSILFILIAAGSMLISPQITGFTSNNIIDSKPKVATFAVCEEKENGTYCKDKIFASCNQVPMEINESYFYCNGERYEVGNLTLGETFLANSTDRQEKSLITAWAISN